MKGLILAPLAPQSRSPSYIYGMSAKLSPFRAYPMGMLTTKRVAESTSDPLLTKLDKLASLPAGWHYGDGSPTRHEVTTTAISLYHQMAKFGLKADAFPWPNGSLSLVFYSGDMCVEINIHSQDEWDLIVEKGYGFEYDEIHDVSDASLEDIERAITTIMEPQWYSPESFIENFTIMNLGDSGLVVLPTPAMALESLPLTWNALGKEGAFHVGTLPTITPKWPESQSSIGMYQVIYPSTQGP